jgi:hypothetical protein
MAPLPGGRVLVAGGLGSGNAPTAHSEIYDPATNRFTSTGAMGTGRAFPSVAPLAGGRVLVAAGIASLSPPVIVTSSEIYEPTTGTWAPAAEMPQIALGAVGAVLPSGEGFLIGGTNGLAAQPAATTLIYAPPTVPDAPAAVAATAGNGAATVSWAPPASDGARRIAGYVITASSGASVTTPDARTAMSFGGLPNGHAVTFTVRAVNALGAGPVSAPSAAVTPVAPDTTAPTLKITGLKSKLKLKAFLKGVTATLTPSESSSLAIDLLASATRVSLARSYNLTLASKSYGLGGARKLKLKPSKTLVGKARRFTVRLRVTATDAAGNRRTVTKTIRVSP